MQLTIKKPRLKKPNLSRSKLKGTDYVLKQPLSFFVDQDLFYKTNLPIGVSKLLIYLLILTSFTFFTYLISNYIRVEDEPFGQILKYVAFVNYGLWLAYLLYMLGVNVMISAVLKLMKYEVNVKEYLLSQIFIASVVFSFIKLVATVLILADELIPFPLEISTGAIQLNLLTILFFTQIWVVVIVYKFWESIMPAKFKTKKWLYTIFAVAYCAITWTLINP